MQKHPRHNLAETKLCLVCQRSFTNRKSWRSRGQWALVKYCSDRCRRQFRLVAGNKIFSGVLFLSQLLQV